MTLDGLPRGAMLDPDALIALRPLALSVGIDPALAALPGGFATRRKGAGLEVADLREYVAGDDIRHMDRSATARTGRLHIRQFNEERDRVTLLVADFRPPMFWGLRRVFRSVAAAEVLALIGWHVVETGGRAALLAVGSEGLTVVPPRPRARGMLDVIRGLVDAHGTGLDALARDRSAEGPRLDQALRRAERLVPAGGEVFIASGFDAPGSDLGDNLNALARRRRVALMHVAARAAEAMPRGTYPVRMHDGRRIKLRFGGRGAGNDAETVIAGHRATVIDAGDPIETTARNLAAIHAGEQVA